MEGAFEILRQALNKEYESLMPEGFQILKLDEFDRWIYTAPHLLIEQKENLNRRYIAILCSDDESTSALGETVNDAVKNCIKKIESYRNSRGDA